MTKQEHALILENIKKDGNRLYKEGKSVREIAEIMGCSFTKVRVTLESMGVTFRPFSTFGLHPGKGIPKSEEHRKKLSESKIGKKLSPEHREKVIKTLRNGLIGSANPRWKGGYTIHGGYMCIKMPEHPKAYSNGYVKRAVLVAEIKVKRHLTEDEITHHINGDKMDDSPDNIEVLNASQHNSITMKQRWLSGNNPLVKREGE